MSSEVDDRTDITTPVGEPDGATERNKILILGDIYLFVFIDPVLACFVKCSSMSYTQLYIYLGE